MALYSKVSRPCCQIYPFLGRCISNKAGAISKPLHYLDGARVDPTNEKSVDDIKIKYPATGEVLCTTRSSNNTDVDRAVDNSQKGFKEWSKITGQERGRVLTKAVQIIRENMEELAYVEVKDTGKPIWEARDDISGCADTIEFYAGLAASISTGQHMPFADGSFAYTRREPFGVCGGIGAWNYPFQMALWKSAPALAVGNTMVFKPSPETPLTAVMLAEIYSDAGAPPGTFNIVQGGVETGQALTSHPDIHKITFTGSVAGGSKVMQSCAKGIKHVSLELGGKSPLIIFEDANLDNAVSGAMLANFLTQGQVCSNGTRVYVHKSVMKPFLEKLVPRVKKMKVGDPLEESTTVGATINKKHAQLVLRYIENAVKEGAKKLCGGERVEFGEEFARGYFLSPCVLTNVTDTDTIAIEEVFGSAMSVFEFEDDEDVLRRANDSNLGLAAGIFTKDLNRAHKMAANLQAGSVYVNNYNVYPSGLPFGGYKKSGIGRENGLETLLQYTQVKAVYFEMNNVESPI